MGQPQRQEYLYETLYGNGEPGTSPMNLGQREVLRLEDLLGDAVAYELTDFAQVQI